MGDVREGNRERGRESIAALWRTQSEYLLYSFISQSRMKASRGTQDKNQVLGNSIDLASQRESRNSNFEVEIFKCNHREKTPISAVSV